MTAAWAGTICSDPVMVSVSIRPERFSHGIISRTREFVINLTTEQLAYAADFCGVRSGRDIDKFSYLKLTKVPSLAVSAPSIGESPVCLECRVTRIEKLGTHDLFIAKVVQISVDEQYLDESGRLRLDQAGLIAYVHGAYFSLGDKLGTFGFSVRKHTERKQTEKNQTGKKQKEKRQKKEKKTGAGAAGNGKKFSAAGRQTTKKNTSAHGRGRKAGGAKIEGA